MFILANGGPVYHGGRRNNNSLRINRKLQILHLNTRKCCFSSLLGVFVYLLVFVFFHSCLFIFTQRAVSRNIKIKNDVLNCAYDSRVAT